MRIVSLHTNHIMPTKGSESAGGHDIYMPEAGTIPENSTLTVELGFAAEVPQGCIALLLPRSSTGCKNGLELNNTCGVIDADYRGEWKAVLKTKDGSSFSWSAGDRLLQFLVIPVLNVTLEATNQLSDTDRGNGGFGSSGK